MHVCTCSRPAATSAAMRVRARQSSCTGAGKPALAHVGAPPAEGILQAAVLQAFRVQC